MTKNNHIYFSKRNETDKIHILFIMKKAVSYGIQKKTLHAFPRISRHPAITIQDNRPAISFCDNRETRQFKFPNNKSAIQRNVTAKPTADATITSDLQALDASLTTDPARDDTLANDPIDTFCGSNTALATALKSIQPDSNGCTGIAMDGTDSFVAEYSFPVTSPLINRVTNRPARLHSETYLIKEHNASKVWTTQNNCFFCYAYLTSRGKAPQGLRTRQFPQFWTHPEHLWQISQGSAINYTWKITRGTCKGHYNEVGKTPTTGKRSGLPGYKYTEGPFIRSGTGLYNDPHSTYESGN